MISDSGPHSTDSHDTPLEIVREVIDPKAFIKEELQKAAGQQYLLLQKRAFHLVAGVYISALILTLSIFFLEGWHLWGFDLPDHILHWLGAAVIGEIASFVYLVLRFFFPGPRNQQQKNDNTKNQPP